MAALAVFFSYDRRMVISDRVRAFVEAQRVARLATVDAEGRPHVVPICFALARDVLYSAIDEKPKREDYAQMRRLRNIAANPQVQVLLDVYDDGDWARLRYAQLRGVARVIKGDDEHVLAIARLRARYRQYEAMELERRPMIAVDVRRVVEWQASR